MLCVYGGYFFAKHIEEPPEARLVIGCHVSYRKGNADGKNE